MRGNCSESAAGYQCSCPTGYTGCDCSVMLRACSSAPCQNGGVCYDYSGLRYLCVCPTGFQGKSIVKIFLFLYWTTINIAENKTGSNCELKIDLCNPNPCQNSGTCVSNSPGTYFCNCLPQYSGNNCEIQIRVIGLYIL